MEEFRKNSNRKGALKKVGAAFHGATLMAGWNVTFSETRGRRRELVCDDQWQMSISDAHTVALLAICGSNEQEK